MQQIGGSAVACTLGRMCHCNNLLFCRGAPAIPVCQQLARAKWKNRPSRFLCLLPDFCVCFLIFPVSRFFPLCIPILWQFLMLSETQGPRCTPLCCLVVTREHDHATRPSYFEVINHKVNNQSSGTATGGALDSKKFAKNWKKGENKSGQKGQNQEKEEKSGRFFHFAAPDR